MQAEKSARKKVDKEVGLKKSTAMKLRSRLQAALQPLDALVRKPECQGLMHRLSIGKTSADCQNMLNALNAAIDRP